ncbi:uncharacterized protein LOC124304954 isoform X1 [Neodiprion virginianus]|uniref:uncharacterized protein LOC124304954 isoform X1 n=1 Tax=Neodiprion virginianus TaxID=2961670 RepID=UPI001EE69903|nr:uncharacterized protein LOC124304954 isoform X1 [Neodiprion virginianus]XP_046619730.1 uncharacterized protein LOC124304954 isoform X1 [Neodiprion virginianus]
MSDTRHQLHSVSDLYAADEIEVLLLEEIRDLEPPPSAYSRPEDIQDFEIAGSRTGGRTSSRSSELESPGVHSTVHSWDSHANYHGHYDGDHNRHGSASNPAPWAHSSHLVLYCDLQGHLRTATGVIRLMLLISSAACLVTLCSSGTAKVSLFMLPLVGRLRLMIFVAVFCLLVTSLLLFLDISHVIYVFPFNWAKLNAWMFAGMGLSYVTASALLVCSVWEYSGGASGWVPRRTRSQLAAAAGLGLACALLALLLSWLHLRSSSNRKGHGSRSHTPTQLYRPVDNSSSSGVTLKERSPKRPPPWVVRNQQRSDKVNANSDSRSENGNNKFKGRNNKKDHWASAKQHFLHSQDDEEEEENRVSKEAKERDKRRKRRKNGGSSSAGVGVGGGSSDNNEYGVSGGEAGSAGLGIPPTNTRCVPRKLPLKSLNNGSQQKQSSSGMGEAARSKQMGVKTLVNSDLKNYWELGNPRTELTNNSSRRINQGVSPGEIIQTDGKIVLPTGWANQWQTAVDDVQPCSSKALDPYPFP